MSGSSDDGRDEAATMTVHQAVGGDGFFVELVDEFYRRVADDPVLRPSYPDDLTESRRTLTLFLIQYWGGPTSYSDERGHPRLRMRHHPFVIGRAERDAWLEHMLAAVAASDAPPQVTDLFRQYFEQASTAMINHPG
jgi:hemoglobin